MARCKINFEEFWNQSETLLKCEHQCEVKTKIDC